MANYASLKAAIQDVIKTNGNNEITGAVLQQSLLAMVNSLGAGYQYAGIATPATNPGTPDQNVFYLASTAGTYTNFDGLVLADGEIAILKYNGAWSKDSTGAASVEMVNRLGQYAGGIIDGVAYYSTPNLAIYNDYYTTPFIPVSGTVEWYPSEINNEIFITWYNSNLEQVNQNRATVSPYIRPNVKYPYARVSFLKNTRTGKLVANGKVVWDNETFDYGHYSQMGKSIRYAQSLLEGYEFAGVITYSGYQPKNPSIPVFYVPGNNPQTYGDTFAYFKDSNGNPIVIPNDGYFYIIVSVFSNGLFSCWDKQRLLFPTLTTGDFTYRFLGIANTNTKPRIAKNIAQLNYYICATPGTYDNFIGPKEQPIVVNENELCVFRSYTSGGSVQPYWVKNTITTISVPDAQIENAVLQYFIDNPAAANQYVVFNESGDSSFAILGPNQNGGNKALCVAVGIANLSNNTGIKNIVVGIQNMINATGSGNVAVGYHALFRLTTGANNVGVGNEALDDNIEGSYNTGIGWGASKRNTDGSHNVSVGNCALHGDYGDGSFVNRPSFNRNTAIGSGAMQYCKSGDNDCVAVGYNARPKPGSSNQIVIGSEAKGEKSNQAVIGGFGVNDCVIGNKRIVFNNDGSVSWIQLYSVSFYYTRTNLTEQPPFVDKNSSFQTSVVLDEGYTELAVATVTMGGVDITSTAFNPSTNEINIPNVTGNIIITMRVAL